MYRCRNCGRQEYEHRLIQQPWVQIPLPFRWSPFRPSPGYRKSLVACTGFELSRKDRAKQRGPGVVHEVFAIMWRTGGVPVLVDIGS